ncbi:MAG: dockerin type I domain-containing protein [Clostridium sp.]|nr:dockerin type I domain-containing protein [Clostridium sp.]
MKKNLKHLFSAAICAIMLFACVFPNFAAADTELSSVDAEKLEAFFARSAGDGRHNFDHPDYAGGVYGSYTVSNFSESPCVGIEDGVIRWFDFNPDAMGSILRTSPVLDFRPRFCGVFDLSGTSVTNVYSPVPGQTHITAVNLDGCANLERLEFGDQNECFDISALNCPNLNIIDLRTYHSGNVAVQPKSFSAPVMLNTLGNGGAGLYGRDGSYALIAQGVRYDENGNLIENDGFLGWYANGQLLSTEREMQLSDGIRAAACFAGDVNEDGAINMADALLIMRCAMELGGELPLRLADADRNGSIGIPDALLAARVAMGN